MRGEKILGILVLRKQKRRKAKVMRIKLNRNDTRNASPDSVRDDILKEKKERKEKKKGEGEGEGGKRQQAAGSARTRRNGVRLFVNYTYKIESIG